MAENQNDEIPLGYLLPSSKPGSLGRLGHYEVHEVLGRGAFGTVLKAFDEKLHRVVAIKVLAPEMAATSPARKRFIREAQASAAIRHEHVVSIYAVEESPIPYLVMEYIPGLTLQQRLDERGPLDVPTVLKLGRQIAEGLAGAHAQELIHRDIKPGNILLETSVHDRVKITDFGLARAADDASLTQSGTIAGTPMYMAPEQALGHKLDQRADLFSFGSVLYQMVSGRPPFRANGTLAVLKRVTEDTPRPISEIIPETPAWLCSIISKLHAKNPDERYQTAQEIADVLADCEAQLKEHSGLKDLSRIPRAQQPRRVGWWKWIAAAVLVVPLVEFGRYALSRPEALPKVAWNSNVEPSKLDPLKSDSALATNQVTQQGMSASDGWVQLFNGQDLTGWKNDDDHWTIENGMLVTRLSKGAVKTSGFLQTIRKDYRDFHVRAEVKINAEGDSGLFFRFGEQGDVSLQAQITTNPGSVGSLLRHAATIVPGSQWVPADTWFTLEVIAQGPRVAVFVDGQEAATWFDPTGGTQAGPIGFESGFPGTEFFVRKVEIKSPTNSTPVDFNGTWESDWGDVTFTQDLFTSEASPMMGGTYNQGTAHIGGTINLQSRVFVGTFRENTGPTGRIRLTLSPDGTSISGRYYHANLNEPLVWQPERASMVWNMTRREAGSKADPQPLAKNEWVQLFNGKDLTSWKFHPNHRGDWEVRDGILRGSTRHSHLFSERSDYGNFHLRAEVKVNLGGDSGILFRAPFELRRGRTPNEFGIPGCYEAELQQNRSHPRPTGSISEATGDAPPTPLGQVIDRSLTQPDEWFTIEVIAENNHFITKINGSEAANCSDPLDRHRTGHLALQVWHLNTLVQFRKIEIRELLPTPAPQESLSPTHKNSIMRALRELVVVKEGERDQAKQSFRDGQLSNLDLIYAEIDAIDARIQLAQAERDMVANLAALRSLVAFRQQERELIAQRVKAGAVKEDELERADSSLSDANSRLGKAIADAPATAFFTEADVQRISALPVAQQVAEVRQELIKRNLGFDGALTPTIENDVVTGLEFFTDRVADISPVRALTHLTSLNCRADGSIVGMVSDLRPLKGMQLVKLTLSVNPVSDLTPLKGMPLSDLHIDNSHVADLSPLEGMPLKVLNCSYTKVSSLAPLKGMPLTILWSNNTEIANLSPVKGMSLEWITFQGTKVTDPSPLKGMPLTQIYLDFDRDRDGEFLRSLTTLQKINDKPTDEFWKDADKK